MRACTGWPFQSTAPVGVLAEEGELLYNLVRLNKPVNILETGTNVGISARYMALGLRENIKGNLVTIEHLGDMVDESVTKLARLGVYDRCHVSRGEVSTFGMSVIFDMMFLDSELDQRFGELERFWPHLNIGGLVIIHDLPRLETEGFGSQPDLLWDGLRRGLIGRISIPSPHGLTIFQKHKEAWS